MSIKITPQDVILHEMDALDAIPIYGEYEKTYTTVVDMLCILKRSNAKLITSGVGKAGDIAKNVATTFCSVGLPAVFLHPVEALHGDLGVIQHGDGILFFSNSGKTKELIQLWERIINLGYSHFVSVLITGNERSLLAKKMRWSLPTGNPSEVCPFGLTPTTSTTCMSVIGDILVAMVTERSGMTVEDYYKRHHGGYLGQKVKQQIK